MSSGAFDSGRERRSVSRLRAARCDRHSTVTGHAGTAQREPTAQEAIRSRQYLSEGFQRGPRSYTAHPGSEPCGSVRRDRLELERSAIQSMQSDEQRHDSADANAGPVVEHESGTVTCRERGRVRRDGHAVNGRSAVSVGGIRCTGRGHDRTAGIVFTAGTDRDTVRNAVADADHVGRQVIAPWAALNEIFTRPVPPALPADAVNWKNADDKKAQLGLVRGPVSYRICYVEGPEYRTEFPNDPAKKRDRFEQYRDLVVNPPPSGTIAAVASILSSSTAKVRRGATTTRRAQKRGTRRMMRPPVQHGNLVAVPRAVRDGVRRAPAPSPSPQAETPITLTFAQPLNAFWRVSAKGMPTISRFHR